MLAVRMLTAAMRNAYRYNAINGVPSCANNWLQNDVARTEWQFDGYITSDCDADADVVYSHHYHNGEYAWKTLARAEPQTRRALGLQTYPRNHRRPRLYVL